MSEHDEQVAVINWTKYHLGQWPELEYLYAIPNGGKRHKRTAARLKAEGAKAGVSDLHLPIARGSDIGLWIEMKFGKNKPTKSQIEWIEAMRTQGHRAEVCNGWEEAVKVLEEYMTQGANLP